MIENATTEFKREYSESIKYAVIAFANGEGGRLYVGVNDDGSVCGVSDVDDTMLRIGNLIRGNIKPDVSMFVGISAEQIDGKSVVVVEVQRGSSRPYYLVGKGVRPEGVYVRMGAASVPASDALILDMIRNSGAESYEQMCSLCQELTFREAERVFAEKGVAFGREQMRSLGMIDEADRYTNLALLLSDECPHGMKLAVFQGGDKVVFQDRRELTGSLLRQFEEVEAFVARNNRMHSEIEGMHRRDRADYPVPALREALLNAIIHRDYGLNGATLVSMFDDRMEVTNIGGLVKGITYDDVMMGISVLRNRRLAEIFYRLGLVEAYGTGIPKIKRSYEASAESPLIQVTDHVFKVVLPNRNVGKEGFFDNPVRDQMKGVPSREKIVLEMLSEKNRMTRKEVQEKLAISQTSAIILLRKLVSEGRLMVYGRGRMASYGRIAAK